MWSLICFNCTLIYPRREKCTNTCWKFKGVLKSVATPFISPLFTPYKYPSTSPPLPDFSCILNPQSVLLGRAYQKGPRSNRLRSNLQKTEDNLKSGSGKPKSTQLWPFRRFFLHTLSCSWPWREERRERFKTVKREEARAGRMRRWVMDMLKV